MEHLHDGRCVLCTCLLSPGPQHQAVGSENMPPGGFWSSHRWSEPPSSCCLSWTSGLAPHHASRCPETAGDDDQINNNILKPVCRSRPTSPSDQSHRDTAVVGLVGLSRRNLRGMTLLLFSLRAARRCSFLFTAGSSPWRDATQTRI